MFHFGLIEAGCDLWGPSRIGPKVNERFETNNGHLRIRVTAYAEENVVFVAGAYYVFESSAMDSSEWRRILIFRHDDPVPIPRNQICFLDDRIAYVFMGFTYAVTLDGGKTWSLWKGDQNLGERGDCRYLNPKQVSVAKDGTGLMVLDPLDQKCGSTRYLYTNDYGQHWTPEGIR
jgi:photosystem II stability/assembly factor-like uncharacterized protein